MKILVVIANFGTKNDSFLARLLAEYRSMPYEIDIVVTSNISKDLGKDVEVLVGLPIPNPHSLPFAHRAVFAAREDAYDLYIYTEDDILITQRNIEAFLHAVSVLPPDEIVGFFRWEQYPNGAKYYPEFHQAYRWLPNSRKVIGDHVFARFNNDHSGCYALTRDQLARAMDSGGFMVAPHEFHYGMLETAATDLYTQCGFTKLVCISHLDDFMVPHLPNKYIGSRLGTDAPDVLRQLEVMRDPHWPFRAAQDLLEPKTKLFHYAWSKDLYEPGRQDLPSMFPPATRCVLSIGCGWGKLEAELIKRGIGVTAIPVDSVIGVCAESRGVKILPGGFDSAMEQLQGQRFDGVLLSGALHLLPDPQKTLQAACSLLSKDGILVATIPNFRRLPFLWLWFRNPRRYSGWRDFQRSGVHPTGRSQAKNWFRHAGLSLEEIAATVPARWKSAAAALGKLGEVLFASEFTFVCRQTRNTGEVTLPSLSRPQSEMDTAQPAMQLGVQSR